MWEYDDEAGVQRLSDIWALCPMCHAVQHLGHTSGTGRMPQALAHMARVNGWSLQDAQAMAEVAFEQWALRSRRTWGIDLSALASWGFDADVIDQLQRRALDQRRSGPK
jgi:hypothetical protein